VAIVKVLFGVLISSFRWFEWTSSRRVNPAYALLFRLNGAFVDPFSHIHLKAVKTIIIYIIYILLSFVKYLFAIGFSIRVFKLYHQVT